MFRKPTVFVLGAGASWHYGYPTGEQLVDGVIEMAKALSAHCDRRVFGTWFRGVMPKCVLERMVKEAGVTEQDSVRLAWQRVGVECKALVERLRTVRPLVIDYFLFQNPDLRSIGTMMIAAVILEREGRWTKRGGNDNRRPKGKQPNEVDLTAFDDDWLRFVVHKLLSGCKSAAHFAENNIHFVTFNYDVSLEFHLVRALQDTQMLDEVDVAKFVSERTVHVYGSVHSTLPSKYGIADDVHVVAALPQVDDDPSKLQLKMEFLDRCLVAAASIRTIGQLDKDQNADDLGRARQWIGNSTLTYILGYGFDEQNNARIGLGKLSFAAGGDLSRTVLFTNYENPNSVNKRVSRLLLGEPAGFINQAIVVENRRYFEKSERDVYQALAKDFDAVEEY